MRARSEDLVAAASTIRPEVLEEAKAQVAGLCEDYIRWAEIFSERLYLVGPGDLHRFARALALVMLGHLPTRPQTCPFCIQHPGCEGCGYALSLIHIS
ncbi:MAG: hypothetical protein QUS08_05900, partial [Methanothrix sp.]|nr:hypothetical protein [Methanothrix sp.]